MTPIEVARARVQAAWVILADARARLKRLRHIDVLDVADDAQLAVRQAERSYREAVEEMDAVAARARGEVADVQHA